MLILKLFSLVLGLAGVSAAPVTEEGWTPAWNRHHGRRDEIQSSGLLIRRNETADACIHKATAIKAPYANVWEDLTADEARGLYEWLIDPAQGLNLTSFDDATISDNYVDAVQPYRPDKKDAVAYLAGGAKPEKRAKVEIVFGGLEVPVIKTFIAGPIPVTNETKLQNADFIHTNPHVPWNGKDTRSPGDGAAQNTVINATLLEYSDLLTTLTGHNYSSGALGAFGLPNNKDGSYRKPWTHLMVQETARGDFWMAYTGLHMQWDWSGTDASLWKLLRVVYDDQVFKTMEELKAAYQAGTVKVTPQVPPATGAYTRERPVNSTTRPLENLKAPTSVSADGLRYKVDRNNKYVEWLDWSFYLSFDSEQGLRLHDVNFKGERIIWEASIEDAVANYAGSDPQQAMTAYLDRGYDLGGSASPLARGYDCNAEATYFDLEWHQKNSTTKVVDGLCIFEADWNSPLARHYGGDRGSTKGTVFIVRIIAAVSNYMYDLSYTFYADGSFEAKTAASGYLQTTYWSETNADYGTRVSEVAMGSLHDHVILYRFDLDIAGKENSLEKKSIEIVKEKLYWQNDDDDEEFWQKKIKTEVIKTEDESKLNWSPNMESMFSIGNRESNNTWGYPRSYRVHPGYGTIFSTLNGKKMESNANFAKHNLYVTKHKESERTASSRWNAFLPKNPPIDFDEFFDSESLVQEDLVLWANVGMHHFPRAEDVPNTLFNEARSSIVLSPFNYASDELSRDLTNAFYSNDGETAVEYTQGSGGATCLPAEPELTMVMSGFQPLYA